MFVDYITLMLINMVAGLFLLGTYFLTALGAGGQKHWVPAFAVVGLVAVSTGLHMTLTWPLPKLAEANLAWANTAFGEMSVLFGALFLGAALAVARGWSLTPLAIYAFFAGVAAVLVGVRMIDLGLSRGPALSGAGFILAGLAGVLACPVVTLRTRLLRIIEAVVLFAAAVVWALVGYGSYWAHLERFSQV